MLNKIAYTIPSPKPVIFLHGEVLEIFTIKPETRKESPPQTIPNLQWLHLRFFNFLMMWKWYALSRSRTLSPHTSILFLIFSIGYSTGTPWFIVPHCIVLTDIASFYKSKVCGNLSWASLSVPFPQEQVLTSCSFRIKVCTFFRHHVIAHLIHYSTMYT